MARDFAGRPEAWDLRARRHTLGLAADAPAAARAAAVRAAAGVYEQGLAAVHTPEMVAVLLQFLRQQAAALDGSGAEGGASRALRDTAEWLRQRTQEAFEEAAADGLLTEALRLHAIAFFLHCGDAHAAVAAARAGVHALPQSAALWQQLLVLEAVSAAEQLAVCGGPAALQQQEGGSSSSSEDDEAGPEGAGSAAQQRLEETALQALRAVPAADAVPVWLTAVTLLCGSGCSLQALSQQLLEAIMRQSKGPAEVRERVCAGGG